MTPTFEWDNPDALLAQVQKMLGDRAAGLRRVPEAAIRRGTVALLRLVQQQAPKKTSTLVRSITMVVERLGADLIEGRVGTWLKYARYLEEGTGIYGPMRRPIEICAKAKKGLFWGAYDSNGGPLIRRRVIVKGIEPRGFFASAVAVFLPQYAQIIEEELAKEIAA